MRTNPINDSWEFLSGVSGPHFGIGNWRFLLATIFWVAIGASIAVAIRNWQADPAPPGASNGISGSRFQASSPKTIIS